MSEETGTFLILHGGALGDLVLTLQLARGLSQVDAGTVLRIVSRVNPGDLSRCRPSIERVSPEGLGLHWLHVEGDEPPPERLRELVAGRRVLNALGDVDSVVHRRLLTLGARAVYSFDPRARPESVTHITAQWQRELERQGLLFPKCIYHNRGRAALAVPEEIRRHGQHLLERMAPGSQPPAAMETGLRGSTAEPAPGRRMDEHGRTSRPWQPILIHPGSGGAAKCWPLPCFLDVGRRLRADGHDVCFVVGPAEIERWPSSELDAIRAEFTLIEYPTADDLLNLLAATGVFISNDAGPAHLASLLGTPTLTLFGPTSATVWRPLGPRAQAIQGDPAKDGDDWGIDPLRVVEATVQASRRAAR
jgi:hypothetical protein